MAMGCGRFTETELMEYLFEPAARPALARHLATCDACRSEIAALEKTGTLLRHVEKQHEAVRKAFARSVVADYRKSAPVPAPSFLRRLLEHVRTPQFLSLAGATALCLLVVAAYFNGWLPYRSTGDGSFTSVSLGHVEEGTPELMVAMEQASSSPGAGEETFDLFLTAEPSLFSSPAPGSPVVGHVFAAAVHTRPDGSLEPEGLITRLEPGLASFHTLTYLLLSEGSHEVHMALFDPYGALVAAQHLPPVTAEGSDRVEAVWVQWREVAFTEEGTHRLVVTVDGVETSFAVPIGAPLW